MNNIIDTKDLLKIENEFPKIALGDKLYEVNDLQENAKRMDEMLKKQDENIDKDYMVLVIAFGDDKASEISKMKLKSKVHRNLVQIAMATVYGMTIEEFKEAMNSKN